MGIELTEAMQVTYLRGRVEREPSDSYARRLLTRLLSRAAAGGREAQP